MKKLSIVAILLFLLSGCVSQGTSVNVRQGILQQAQKTLNQMIYLQAETAMNARMEKDYSVLIEPVSGNLMTLLKEKDQEMSKLIIHGSGYTQWIQIFDDRILCLTGDNGSITVELRNDLYQTDDLKTIMECAQNPVKLVKNRSFQRVSGAEEGSLQIATDNIDYWMKVSSEQQMDQVRLYFSDLPMMTMTYSNQLPAFPQMNKEDYPTYKEYLNITDEKMEENGFEMGERVIDTRTEKLKFIEDQFLMDYSVEDEDAAIQLIYSGVVLKGFYKDKKTGAFCEAVLIGDEDKDDEINCDTAEYALLKKYFEQLKEEFK